MSDNLGTFNEEEFAVMKPKQQTTTPPPPPKDDKKKKPEEQTDDENLDEIPLKTKEEILDSLKKAGVIKDEETPDDESKEDGGDEPKDDEGKEDGGEKPTDDKGTEDGGEKTKKKGKEGKVDKGQIEDIEGEKRRDKIKATSIINKKINDYEEVLIKDEYGVFKLPNRIKQTLLNAKKDLEALKEKL